MLTIIHLANHPADAYSKFYEVHASRDGVNVTFKVTTALAHCCTANAISYISDSAKSKDYSEEHRRKAWRLIIDSMKQFHQECHSLAVKAAAERRSFSYPVWSPKDWFYFVSFPHVVDMLKEFPEVKEVDSFTNSAHGGPNPCKLFHFHFPS